MSTVPTENPTELPAFDNTLGGPLHRVQSRDGLAHEIARLHSFGLDTAQQGLTLAGMYRFLITDYANPTALVIGGSTSGQALTTYDEGIVGTAYWFRPAAFSWYSCKETFYLVLLLAYMDFQCLLAASPRPNRNYRYRGGSFGCVALAFLNFGQWDKTAFMILGLMSFTFQSAASSIALSIFGYRHRFLTANTPEFTILMVSFALFEALSLYRSRSGMKSFFFSIAPSSHYLVLPNATIYGGITFLLSKSYLNSFLAILNTREYLREKMEQNSQPGQSSVADFAGPSVCTATTS
ncbi:hypothetical protein F5146DRAFT_998081 [Armillaria mellea]|nr:hypothetical protein F5146DRAFT_998081 [Armillaria mellea]